MSKKIPAGRGVKKFLKGGKAGKTPGSGWTSSGTSSGGWGRKAPTKGFGSKKLGGRPPKNKPPFGGGGEGRGPKGDE